MARTEHPSLDLVVTEPQRERSLAWLNQAFAEGRISAELREERVEQVLLARTRRELNAAFDSLARIPVGTGASLAAPRPPGVPGPFSRGAAAVAHFSALGSWVVGPGVAYVLAPEGGNTRREAARAFNFQLVSGLLVLLARLLLHGAAAELVMPLLVAGWMLLTVLGGARAAQGRPWSNPVTTVVPLRVLDEGPRAPRRRALASPARAR